ncbi:unnamed protein product [Paramecium pentaurelia]|uniref:Uncharacterized protein n=1 Tax=Paramecium pentaurelia TaxID=43138 RepID=A0A8S1VUT0_9CILI|nr:unnamed protein product [Paramecium pentaurelia]
MFLEITFMIKMKSLQRQAIDSQKINQETFFRIFFKSTIQIFISPKDYPVEQIIELRQIHLFII